MAFEQEGRHGSLQHSRRYDRVNCMMHDDFMRAW
jgi:hypothetical protein